MFFCPYYCIVCPLRVQRAQCHTHIHVYDRYTSSGIAHMYTLSYRISNDEQASVRRVSAGKYAVYRDRMQMNHIPVYIYTCKISTMQPIPLSHITHTHGQRLRRYFSTGTTCICTHTHTHTQTHIHTLTHSHTHIHTTDTHTYSQVYHATISPLPMHMYTHTHIHMYHATNLYTQVHTHTLQPIPRSPPHTYFTHNTHHTQTHTPHTHKCYIQCNILCNELIHLSPCT